MGEIGHHRPFIDGEFVHFRTHEQASSIAPGGADTEGVVQDTNPVPQQLAKPRQRNSAPGPRLQSPARLSGSRRSSSQASMNETVAPFRSSRTKSSE
jgi:hypothetical protein